MSLFESLKRAPYAYDFHVALRRVETLFRNRPRFGETVRPSDEPLRLGQDPTMAFTPSVVADFKPPAEEGGPARLVVTFLGLFGSQGPLPTHLTEYARDRIRHSGDRTFAAFVDVFHHRMLSLFHRVWGSVEPTVAEDRPETSRFPAYVGSLAGLGLKSASRRDCLPDRAKLQFSALLADPVRHPEGLRGMVQSFFELPTGVEEFVGEWLDLPDNARWRLGGSPWVSSLGETSIIGKRVFRRDHKFRVVLGPLSNDDFERFLPGSESLERLKALVRAYVGDQYDWDVRLVAAPDAMTSLCLARRGRLAWNARVGPRVGQQRREDLIVDPITYQTRRLLA
ncbi:MAG TPA: type VI secretion system baseplate subunit TssG [Polyangiaceae bacterium]|nr:type VI secretion system baseplate subunit TssG [Polyangiaceae bacterium]